jgi:hypothetical protein
MYSRARLSRLSALALEDLERLQRDVRGVYREIDMVVDESWAHRPLGEIGHPCAGGAAH